ncbi:hypothetical protein EVJ58_g10439 [Rhodofomes roseus]|uniref:Uncharacterized protein n=1 Tax=Rhodofomes roseus TaxID=34475 RepID=A0A4Y9XQN5_9APHY|nr:hypothetical protein EVJ58_g10439 [Rhodofomes roseus]
MPEQSTEMTAKNVNGKRQRDESTAPSKNAGLTADVDKDGAGRKRKKTKTKDGGP